MSKTKHYDSKGALVTVEPTPKEVKIGELEATVNKISDPDLRSLGVLLLEIVRRLPNA